MSSFIPSNLIGVNELKRRLGCSRQAIYTLIKQGMPHYWLSGRKFILDEVLDWIQNHREIHPRGINKLGRKASRIQEVQAG